MSTYQTKPDRIGWSAEIEPCREFLILRIICSESDIGWATMTLQAGEVKKLRKELKKWLKTGRVGDE